jgi:hypothetical protein
MAFKVDPKEKINLAMEESYESKPQGLTLEGDDNL